MPERLCICRLNAKRDEVQSRASAGRAGELETSRQHVSKCSTCGPCAVTIGFYAILPIASLVTLMAKV